MTNLSEVLAKSKGDYWTYWRELVLSTQPVNYEEIDEAVAGLYSLLGNSAKSVTSRKLA